MDKVKKTVFFKSQHPRSRMVRQMPQIQGNPGLKNHLEQQDKERYTKRSNILSPRMQWVWFSKKIIGVHVQETNIAK